MGMLLKLRKEKIKMNQNEIALITGIPQGTISKMEREVLDPSLKYMKFIGDKLGSKVVWKIVKKYGKK